MRKDEYEEQPELTDDPYERGFADKLYGEWETPTFPAYNADFGKKVTPKSAYTAEERLNPSKRRQERAEYVEPFGETEKLEALPENYGGWQMPYDAQWYDAETSGQTEPLQPVRERAQRSAEATDEPTPRRRPTQETERRSRSAQESERRARPAVSSREGNDEEMYEQPPKKKHTGRRVLLSLFGILLLLVALGIGGLHLLGKQPKGESDGVRKSGSTTILIAGTDASGDRTDTIMLMNINRSEKRISLMSIPRDTKVNSTYTPHKINSAYGVNGKGKEGMESLMDYVSDCVGFRPDGYVLVDLDIFVELVDLMGGVEFYVPCDMDYDSEAQGLSIHLSEGLQMLDGEQAMGVVRFRSGYAMADIQRVSVQRDFIMAALKQWASLKNVSKLPAAMKLLKEYSVTDLSTRNLIWLAESAALCGTSDMQMMTIPYYLDSYYVIVSAGDELFEMVNTYFNPYEKDVTWDDLNIAY